jgi:isoleucyl-tRNA synthetase
VRRSRRRFWNGEPAALATLHECVTTLTQLMAPFTPFLTERVWEACVAGVVPDAAESVHLSVWPEADSALIDPALGEQMAVVRRVVELGRAARAASGVKTRQPLGRALVSAAGFEQLSAELRAQIADELNVGDVQALTGDLVDVTVKPNFRTLGKRFGSRTQPVAAAIRNAGPPAADGSLTVDVEGEQVTLGAGELIVTETPREGWAVTSEAGASVALDLELTPALRREGMARDVVRALQEARKQIGLDVTDRIEVWWALRDAADPNLGAALREHGDAVAAEVLAVAFAEGIPAGDLARHEDAELGLRWWLRAAGQ